MKTNLLMLAEKLYDKVLELEHDGGGPRIFDYCCTEADDPDYSRVVGRLLNPLIEILRDHKETLKEIS